MDGRRTVLLGLATALAATVSGCMGGDDDSDDDTDTDDKNSESDGEDDAIPVGRVGSTAPAVAFDWEEAESQGTVVGEHTGGDSFIAGVVEVHVGTRESDLSLLGTWNDFDSDNQSSDEVVPASRNDNAPRIEIPIENVESYLIQLVWNPPDGEGEVIAEQSS